MDFRLVLLLSGLWLSGCGSLTRQVNGNQAPDAPQVAAIANTRLGLAYLRQGDTLRARKKLLHALQIAPMEPEVLSGLAWYFEKTGDVSRAETYYRKALALAPESGAQCNNYGTFLCRQGQYRQSLPWFEKAVKDMHYLNTAGAYENAGLCALAIPEEPVAAGYFRKALEQEPGRKQSVAALAAIESRQSPLLHDRREA